MKILRIKNFPNIRKTEIKEAIEKGMGVIEVIEILPISLSKGSLIDFETTSFDVNYAKALTFGCITNNTLKIIQILKQNVDLKSNIENNFKSMSKPFYAYN